MRQNKMAIHRAPVVMSARTVFLTSVVLMAFFAPMGAAVLSINIGVGHLGLFRLFLLTSLGILAMKQKVRLWECGNKYSVQFFLFWILYSLTSIVWSYDLSGFLKLLYFLLIGILVIILVENIYEAGEVNKVMWAMNLGFFVQGVIGFYEHFTGDYRYISDSDLAFFIAREVRDPVAMLDNTNDFATAMYLGIVLSLYFLFDGRLGKLKRMINLVFLLLYSYLIIVGGSSRAVLYGFVIAIGFMIFMGLKRSNKIIAVTITILMLPLVIPRILPHLGLEYFRRKGGSFSVRVNLIRNGFDFLVRTFGFGVGNGQIEYWMRNNASWETQGIENMHNYWIEILVAYGVIVFLFFIFFYLKLIRDFYGAYTRNRKAAYGKQMLVMSAGIVGLFMTLISSSSNMNREYVWLFWAICIALQRDCVDNTRRLENGI